MRKLVFLIVISVFISACSNDIDSTPDFYLEVLPVKEVVLPTKFSKGQSYEIEVTYIAPNSCYTFNGFSFQGNNQERTVGIVNSVDLTDDCNNVPEEVRISFDFTVDGTESIVFKFYKGLGNTGNNEFYTVEVPIIE